MADYSKKHDALMKEAVKKPYIESVAAPEK